MVQVLQAAVIVPSVSGHVRHTDQARGLAQCGAPLEMSVVAPLIFGDALNRIFVHQTVGDRNPSIQ